jgi:hypothetical protein
LQFAAEVRHCERKRLGRKNVLMRLLFKNRSNFNFFGVRRIHELCLVLAAEIRRLIWLTVHQGLGLQIDFDDRLQRRALICYNGKSHLNCLRQPKRPLPVRIRSILVFAMKTGGSKGHQFWAQVCYFHALSSGDVSTEKAAY